LVYPDGVAFNSAGDLFVSEWLGNIIELTPGGQQTTFASVSSWGLAFNSAGSLFVSLYGGDISEYTPGGTQSTFASGLDYPIGLAFDNAGDLFEADEGSGNIIELTPGGVQSTLTSGLSEPFELAFQGETLPVPEPSTLGLLAVGAFGITLLRRHQVNPHTTAKQNKTTNRL